MAALLGGCQPWQRVGSEDRPQPDQLRRAGEVFRHAPPELGCLQAQLNIYNPRQSWLTRGIMAQTPQEVNPS